MKFLLPTVAGLALCAMSLHAGSVHQKGQRGRDAIATVQKGDSGVAYASAYNTFQGVLPNVYTPVEFPSDDLDPKNIRHPSGDNTQFEIRKKGLYLIVWDFTVITDSPPTNVRTRLFNVTTGGPYAPQPLQEQRLLEISAQVVAGQKILALREGDVLRLEVSTDAQIGLSEVAIAITRIAVQEGDSEKAYASAYNDSDQVITTVLTFTPLAFAIDNLDPKNIRRPSGDNTRFEIREDGVYLIAWNFTVNNEGVLTRLFNVATNTAYAPQPLQRQAVNADGPEVVAGYKILALRKGDVLSLEASSNPAGAVINPAAIAFIRIAD